MPIFSYRCERCRNEVEVLIPTGDRDKPRTCECGYTMRRLLSTFSFTMPLTGREISYQTLNNENGYNLPARKRDRGRMEMALAKGLDQRPPTIGRGF